MKKRFRILAVDDEAINIQLITAALKNEYDILSAYNGLDAIRQLKEFMPDLILLDVMMPDLSGFEVCRIVKSDEAFADIPVIFLTALDTHVGEQQGLELGGIDYLVKPINLELLKLRVRNHLALKERNDFLKQQLGQPAFHEEMGVLTQQITGREREVLLLVGHGATSREIAERLGIRINTVEVHRANLMRKLKASNAATLARWALIAEQMPEIRTS